MCLDIKKGQKRQRASSDITCYKVVMGVDQDSIVTFFQETPVKIGETYKSELGIMFPTDNYPEIHKGLHSFKYLYDAVRYIGSNWWDGIYCRDGVIYTIYIVECVIPKNSYYFTGKFFLSDAYASTRVKYVKFAEI